MLTVNSLSGFGGTAEQGGTLTATYISTASNPDNQNSYTFSGQDIGTASSDRYIAVLVAVNNTGNGLDGATCTVGGAAMTQVAASPTGSYSGACVFLTDAAFTSGATADVVLTLGGGATSAQTNIGVYTITGATPSVYDTISVKEASPSDTIDVVSDGVLLAISSNGNASATHTWAGVTEDGDASANSWASLNVTATETGRTVTCTHSSSTVNDCMAVVSLQPA